MHHSFGLTKECLLHKTQVYSVSEMVEIVGHFDSYFSPVPLQSKHSAAARKWLAVTWGLRPGLAGVGMFCFCRNHGANISQYLKSIILPTATVFSNVSIISWNVCAQLMLHKGYLTRVHIILAGERRLLWRRPSWLRAVHQWPSNQPCDRGQWHDRERKLHGARPPATPSPWARVSLTVRSGPPHRQQWVLQKKNLKKTWLVPKSNSLSYLWYLYRLFNCIK